MTFWTPLSATLRTPHRTALCATHWQPGQAVFKNLFEAQEFQDTEVHAGMKSQASLVGADRVVELDAPAAVHSDIAVIIFPGDTENDDSIGFGQSFQDLRFPVSGVLQNERHQSLDDLLDCLMKFWFTRIPLLQALHELANFCVASRGHKDQLRKNDSVRCASRSSEALERLERLERIARRIARRINR